jgi:calcineurin-like phosphoesterase
MIEPMLDDPSGAARTQACPWARCDAILVDMHSEVSSEKMAIAHFADAAPALS